MGAPLDEGTTMTGSPGAAPSTPSGVSSTMASPPQSGSSRNGFKKLFGRRKTANGVNMGAVGTPTPTRNEERSPPKSSVSSRNDRSSKKGKRWTRLSTGGGAGGGGGGSTNGVISSVGSTRKEERSSEESTDNTTTYDHPREDTTYEEVPATPHLKEPEVPVPFKHQQSAPKLDPEAEEARRALLMQKKLIKERDGFCRRVDAYDGQVITVDGFPSYELGSYLGGGVAGVVYEGHRLRPMEDYPVRLGAAEETPVDAIPGVDDAIKPPGIINVWGCVPSSAEEAVKDDSTPDVPSRVASILTADNNSMITRDSVKKRNRTFKEDQALEMTVDNDQLVIIEGLDAPSRSDHYAKAVSMNQVAVDTDDTSISYGFMEETVAIKVLNPVGFRTLAPDSIQDAVVARKGARMEPDVILGKQPMEERHVWWLVNPNSRNLRTLQRYSVPSDPTAPRRVEVDRGSADRGLRISLVAAYRDENNQLKELPLTRCIEIWGHVPFGASDAEFRGLMKAIDAINAGHPPPALPSFFQDGVPGRVATQQSGYSTSNATEESSSLESHRPKPMESKRTGIYRAATTGRTTVYCDELKAYVALPAVPSKYIKWLRQRRAATKEIRNMMLIGRHRNVVHLFEVLELIQEKKSTMFLILELVRGGELFDLISSNAAKLSKGDIVPPGYTESETVMRKFFRELASGVRYCHHNGIAHRDLKPENLLVHNGKDGKCTLKIADFGLSAVFNVNGESISDDVTFADSSYISSYMSAPPPPEEDFLHGAIADDSTTDSPIKASVSKIMRAGGSALSFFTCGVVDEALLGPCSTTGNEEEGQPSPLKRMTSVVGSPHYVAPEIISQNEKRRNRTVGYDGTKADVWSAGVILYAMLFRSLPFGEDLLRCPRFQSFKKWYDEVKHIGRRASALASLDPIITEQEERDLLGPQWFFPSKTSPESRDLIIAMLNPDPDYRPSINMVLRHPWLLKTGGVCT
ncbi:hypothetical protein ACA910_001256 [Epithemia clementina (nom. ined.)]